MVMSKLNSELNDVNRKVDSLKRNQQLHQQDGVPRLIAPLLQESEEDQPLQKEIPDSNREEEEQKDIVSMCPKIIKPAINENIEGLASKYDSEEVKSQT